VQETDGIRALILELVEGDTLADRIAKGALPLQEALSIARQIAEALEAAHEKGVVHRDLKPANIKIAPQGVVKVLDFGLAKATAEASGPDLTQSPTVTSGSTRDGVILGTASYMSPEQARGRPVDKRTDIWAFGCVLYEMLTGRGAFGGETVSDTLAAILGREPDAQALPSATPPKVRDLLLRCLQKDPQRRLRDIGDARLDIDEVSAAPLSRQALAGTARRPPIWAFALAAAIGALAASLLLLRPSPEVPAADLALTIAPPAATGIVPVTSALATPRISPNGGFVAYFDRSRALQLRRLSSISAQALPAVKGLFGAFWSPDSKSLFFSDGNQLKRIVVPDGAPEIIGSLPGAFPTAGMSDSGALLFVCCTTRNDFGLFLLPEAGAQAREIHIPGLKEGSYSSVSFLPGSEDFLVDFTPLGSQENELHLVTLRNGEPVNPVLLLKDGAGPMYTPAGGGRLLFVKNDNLYAQRLNRQTRQLEGDAQLVQQNVASGGAGARFSVSNSGILAFRSGRQLLAQVTVFDRQGQALGSAGSPMVTGSLKVSPDEKHVLIAERTGRAWLLEPNQPARQSLGQGDLSMLWSPDGSGFLLPRPSRIVARRIVGSSDDVELASVPDIVRLEDVSGDGKLVLFRKGTNQPGVFSVRLDGRPEDRSARSVQTDRAISNVHLSPDQRWIVYQVDGPEQDVGVYVQRFPGPALPTQITSSGESPVWAKNGNEIVYLDRDRIWSIGVTVSGGQFRAAAPEPLFSVRSMEGGRRVSGITQLGVSRDGLRIYYQQPVEQPDSDVIQIRTGWDRGVASQ
jgi:hypothetical protein